MKIYLGARYPRREELRGYAEELAQRRHTVVSTWVTRETAPEDAAPEGDERRMTPEQQARLALRDLGELTSADAAAFFTEECGSTAENASRGGRHVEFGYALGACAGPVIVVGPREALFYHHPRVVRLIDFAALLYFLGRGQG